MNRYGFAVLILGIVAIAAWTYNINYRTQTVLDRVATLRDRIAAEHERGQVLRVEWAYLSAPERLSRLVARYNDRLGLVPLQPGHMRDAAVPPFPAGTREPPAPNVATPGGDVPTPKARPGVKLAGFGQ